MDPSELTATQFFLLIEGGGTVHRSGRHVADPGPGDVFGERGVLALKPREVPD